MPSKRKVAGSQVPPSSASSQRSSQRIITDDSTQLSPSEDFSDVDFVSSAQMDQDDDEDSNDEDYESRPKRRKTTKKSRKQIYEEEDDDERVVDITNIDNIPNFEENILFQDLSDSDTSLSSLAQAWIEDFAQEDLDSKFNALKDLINLILRLAGCTILLSKDDVQSTDSAKDTIMDLQRSFSQLKMHEFPLLNPPVGKLASEWVNFQKNVGLFFECLIDLANQRGILYEGEFMELIIEWLSVISTSNVRSLRIVATFACLRMENKLCSIIVQNIDFVNKTEKQLLEENKQLEKLIGGNVTKKVQSKIDVVNKRIKQIELNLENFKSKKDNLKDTILEIFQTIFIHRYRDVCGDIRFDCIKHLGIWMQTFPEMFFDVIYMRYLGWTMTDNDSQVRAEAFKILTILYQSQSSSQSLKQFTDFFKSKLINIAIYETDPASRLNCLKLLIQVIQRGFLSDDEIIQLTSMIFLDNEDILYQFQGGKPMQIKFTKELSLLISTVEKSSIEELTEDNFSINITQVSKIKRILDILDESYVYYLHNYCFDETKQLLINSKYEKFANIGQHIYSLPRYNDFEGPNQMFETYLSYLTFDFYPYPEYKRLELTKSNEQTLLNILMGISEIFIEGFSNQFYKVLFPRFKNDVYDSSHFLSKLVSKLTNFYDAYQNQMEPFTILVDIVGKLVKGSVIDQNQTLGSVTDQIVHLINQIDFPVFDDEAQNNSQYFESINYQYHKLLKLLEPTQGEYMNEILQFKQTLSQNLSEDKISSSLLSRLAVLISNEASKKIILDDIGDELVKTISILTGEKQDADWELCLSLFIAIFSKFLTFHLTEHLNPDDTYLPPSILMVLKKFRKFFNISNGPDLLQKVVDCYLSSILSIEAFRLQKLGNENYQNGYGEESIGINVNELMIDSELAEKIIKLFVIREFQYAYMLSIDNKLERHEMDDVNFERYIITTESEISNSEDESNEENQISKIFTKRHNEYLKQTKIDKALSKLCVLTGKLVICYSFGLFVSEEITNTLMSRLRLNESLLGEQFLMVLKQIDSLDEEEEVEEKEGTAVGDENKDPVNLGRKRKHDDEQEEEDNDDEELEESTDEQEEVMQESDPLEESEDDMDMEFSNVDETNTGITQSTL